MRTRRSNEIRATAAEKRRGSLVSAGVHGRNDEGGKEESVVPSVLAGYRVLRRLATGRHSDLFLGQSKVVGVDPADGSDRARTVVLKVFRADADPAAAEREIRVLSEVSSSHLAAMADLATLPDGRVVVVLERESGPTLQSFLSPDWQLGEMITILAPLVQCLGQLHHSGWAHGAVTLSSVVFGAGGSPVLVGLGSLSELPPAGAVQQKLVETDLRQLGLLVQETVDRLCPAARLSIETRKLVRWCGEAAGDGSDSYLHELESRLFALGVPLPVQLFDRPQRSGDPYGVLARVPQLIQDSEPVVAPTVHVVPRWFDVLQLPAQIGVVLERMRERVGTSWPAAVRQIVSRRKGAVLIAVLVSAAVLVTVLTFVPVRGVASPEASAGGGHTDAPTAALVPGDEAVLQGEDPVAAVVELLRLRQECLAAVSLLCLDGSDQQASAVFTADSYQVRLAQQGSAAPDTVSWTLHTPTLVEQTGNSALVSLELSPEAVAAAAADQKDSHPASVLVIKGEAGWRLREIFEF
jgi:hypothetical protein